MGRASEMRGQGPARGAAGGGVDTGSWWEDAELACVHVEAVVTWDTQVAVSMQYDAQVVATVARHHGPSGSVHWALLAALLPYLECLFLPT